MRNTRIFSGWAAVFVLCAVTLCADAIAQTETVLHNFNLGVSPRGGSVSLAGLIFDTAGNLYGTTVEGGTGAGLYTTLSS